MKFFMILGFFGFCCLCYQRFRGLRPDEALDIARYRIIKSFPSETIWEWCKVTKISRDHKKNWIIVFGDDSVFEDNWMEFTIYRWSRKCRIRSLKNNKTY